MGCPPKRKIKSVKCRICGKRIEGRNFASRMKKMRKHYKEEHPYTWKKSVAKAAKKRRKKKGRKKGKRRTRK